MARRRHKSPGPIQAAATELSTLLVEVGQRRGINGLALIEVVCLMLLEIIDDNRQEYGSLSPPEVKPTGRPLRRGQHRPDTPDKP